MSILFNIIRGVWKKFLLFFNNPYRKIGLNWWQTRRLKNLPANRHGNSKIYGHTIKFEHHNEFLHSIDEIFLKEIYKTDFGKIKNPYIIDCGANIGLSVLYFLKNYPQSKILAFEPDEKNYAILKENIADMKEANVEIRQEAVWNEDTIINFVDEGTQSSRINSELSNSSDNISKVKAIRLKNIISDRIDLLKLDIEGAEYDVLVDISDKLKDIERIFLEYHGSFKDAPKLETILSIMTANNFSYYITEANQVYINPFYRHTIAPAYDVQLNIYCFKN